MDYKKYSLENLENWLHDALSAGEASAEEVYNTIKKVVQEQYYHHKHHASQANELLALLNGNGIGHIEAYDAVMREREYYEPSMPPWGHSDLEYLVNQNKILKCDKDDPSPECKGAWNSFWEETYYPEEYHNYPSWVEGNKKAKTKTYDEMIADGWSMTADGFWIREQKKDKVVRWQLPVEVDGLTGECYINLPDDLLEAANLKEGDNVEWVDNGDGSYIVRKVNGIK